MRASMRPGHCAPEKGCMRARTSNTARARFNEAGALCPGKGAVKRLTGYCPEDKASMRPGHCAPEKARQAEIVTTTRRSLQ